MSIIEIIKQTHENIQNRRRELLSTPRNLVQPEDLALWHAYRCDKLNQVNPDTYYSTQAKMHRLDSFAQLLYQKWKEKSQ